MTTLLRQIEALKAQQFDVNGMHILDRGGKPIHAISGNGPQSGAALLTMLEIARGKIEDYEKVIADVEFLLSEVET